MYIPPNFIEKLHLQRLMPTSVFGLYHKLHIVRIGGRLWSRSTIWDWWLKTSQHFSHSCQPLSQTAQKSQCKGFFRGEIVLFLTQTLTKSYNESFSWDFKGSLVFINVFTMDVEYLNQQCRHNTEFSQRVWSGLFYQKVQVHRNSPSESSTEWSWVVGKRGFQGP